MCKMAVDDSSGRRAARRFAPKIGDAIDASSRSRGIAIMIRGLAGVAIAALVSTLSVASCFAQSAAGDDPVVARVNGIAIHRSDVVMSAQNLPEQFRQMPFEVLFPLLLDRMVDLKILVAAARAQNVQDDPVVKRRVAGLEERIIQEVFLTRQVEKGATEVLLRERYKQIVEKNPGQDEISARHILLKTESEAKAVIAELRRGADFADLARKRSIDPAASGGGDLGYFTRDQMVPEFSEAAFKLKKGQTTDAPVKSGFGWHVIKVDDVRRTNPPSFEETREEILGEVSQEIIQSMLKALRAEAKIERFNADGSVRSQ
jgi:peptidyl-prolyl cis-trans isomerase C